MVFVKLAQTTSNGAVYPPVENLKIQNDVSSEIKKKFNSSPTHGLEIGYGCPKILFSG